MYNTLILYRNELKNKNIPKYKLVGIVVELIYSRLIFKKNDDIKLFVMDVFGIEFKEYIMKSRPIVASKIAKVIITSQTTTEYKNKLLKFINTQIDLIKIDSGIKDKKNEFDGWIK